MISIILPTFNRCALLARAIDSVLRQSVVAWELIIVDDGSTDSTASLVAGYKQHEPRIHYLVQKHSGPVEARNCGLTRAFGQFITFLDSDDEYLPEHLERRRRLMLARPDIDLLYGGMHVIGGPAMVPDPVRPGRWLPIEQCILGPTLFMRCRVAWQMRGMRGMQLDTGLEFVERARKRFRVERVSFPTYLYHHEQPGSLHWGCATPGA